MANERSPGLLLAIVALLSCSATMHVNLDALALCKDILLQQGGAVAVVVVVVVAVAVAVAVGCCCCGGGGGVPPLAGRRSSTAQVVVDLRCQRHHSMAGPLQLAVQVCWRACVQQCRAICTARDWFHLGSRMLEEQGSHPWLPF